MCIFMVPRWKPHTCAHTHTNSHGAAGCLPCTHHEFTHVATDGYCETCMHRKNTDRHTHTKVCLLCECEGMNHTYMHTLILAYVTPTTAFHMSMHTHVHAGTHVHTGWLQQPSLFPLLSSLSPSPMEPWSCLPAGDFKRGCLYNF